MSRYRWTALIWMLCAFLPATRALGQTLTLLDEKGAPTAAYAEKTRVYLKVADPAADLSPSAVDTVQARLATALGGDSEWVLLTETGKSTGVFRGDIPLVQKEASSQPGALETGVLQSPPYGRDTITAEYGAATATASLQASILRFLDSYGRPASRFAFGETVFLEALMPLRNSDPSFVEELSFHLFTDNGSDDEWLYLRETGPDTGVFTGTVYTRAAPLAQRNGTLEAAAGQAFTAEVSDYDLPGFSSRADAVMAATSTELIDAQGNPATFFLESGRAYVRVHDAAANLSPTVRNTTTVQLTADLSGDQQTITLQETGTSTEIFEGSVPLLRGAALAGDGKLETTASSGAPYRFDTVRATHSDSTDAVDTIGSLTSFRDAYGNEVTSYAAGARIYLRVEDHNANDPSHFDTVTATVQSPGSSDAEGLTLVETGRDTGIFTGSIATRTAPSASGDGVLAVQPFQAVLAQHVDANGVLASGAQAAIESFDVRFLDEEGEPTGDVLMNGEARVRVTAPSANADPGAAETVTVEMRSLYAQDLEDLVLTETGANTGVFEGSIPLNYAPYPYATLHNTILDAGSSSSPPYQPDQVTATIGGVSATARVAGARVWFIDDYGRPVSTFPVGGNVGVRVIAPSANNPSMWDTLYNFQIGVQYDAGLGSTGTSYYYLSLDETAVGSGVFEGRLPSAAGSTNSNVINAATGRILKVDYVNPYSPAVAQARAVFTGGQVLFVDATGQPASVYMEGTRAYLRVIDSQRSGSVTATVRSEVTGDLESVTLAETGSGTKVFEGSIALSKIGQGAGTPGNQILETGEETSPVEVFDTLDASYTDAAGGASAAAVPTLGYRVWFLDSYSNEVTSYPQGARAYVRIEDHNFDNLGSLNNLYVRVDSASGDSETLLVPRTGRGSSFFEGSVTLKNSGTAASGDGLLIAPPGSALTADLAGSAVPRPAHAQVENASVQFIDDAGRPTAEVLLFGTARVRVVSPVDNHLSNAVETVTAQVRVLSTQDVETLTLTETGLDTGIFEGSLPLFRSSGASPEDGQLEFWSDGGSSPDAVTATFGGFQATANLIGSRAVFIDDFGRETTTFPVGANVGVRLIEPGSNQAPVIDTVYNFEVQVQYDAGLGSTGTSYYYLNLNETGPDTGVFEGYLPSAPVSSGGNVIYATPGRILEIAHTGNWSSSVARAQAVFTAGQVLFVDAQGQPASVYLEGTRAYLRVEDHQSTGTLNVQVTTAISQDQETVQLQPTAPGSGIFTGSIALALGNNATRGNGALETGEIFGPPFEYETLRASYAGSTAEATTLGYRVWFLDPSGAAVTSYLQGTRAYVRLEDHNYNNPNLINTLYAQLDSSSGDQEFLQVTETGPETGIYEGSIPLDRGAVSAGDGRLQAPAGGEITADRQGAWFPAPVHARIAAAAVEFVDEEGRTTLEILENGTARIRVTSLQDNANPAAAESVIVHLRTRHLNDQEDLVLTETGPDTGVFEGSIRLLFNAPQASGNGTLETRILSSKDAITATYSDASATAQDVLQKLAFINLRGQVVGSYPMAARIGVRVRYAIDNDPSVVNTARVNLQNLGVDFEPIDATETGPDTGVFEGWINGSDQLTYYADGVITTGAGQTLVIQGETIYGYSDPVQATITGGHAPRAVYDSVEAQAGIPATIAVLANDLSTGGALSVGQVTQGEHGTVTINPDDTVTYTATADFSGSDSFTYVAVDAQGGEAQAVVGVTVTPANRPPVANDDAVTLDEDSTLDISVFGNDYDPDTDPITVESVTQPAHGSAFLIGNNNVRYVPAPDYNGADSFTYVLGDGSLTATATVSITVRPVNDVPVAVPDTATVAEDGNVDVNVLGNDSDPDGDTLSVASVTQGAHGAVAINPDKTVKYTPAANYNGPDSFTYTGSDGNGGSATATVSITVTAVNDVPVAAADAATVVEDGTVNVNVLGNDTDADGDALSVAAVTQGAHGTVAINPDKTVKYTPAANYNGPDTFTYTVSDGNGGGATGTVTITVTAVNDAPVVAADSATVAEDGTVNVNVLGNDTDADGDTLSVASVTQGAHGVVAINPDKTVKYTPAANYNGPDSFTYTASDGNGGSATATVTITVTPVNDAPVANADSATLAEDGTINVPVLANDTDADGETLSVTSITPAGHGTVGINPDKTVRYTPTANYNGSDAFTYTVSDGQGGSATGTVSITITSINDVPVANADSATIPEDGSINLNVLFNDTDGDGDTLSVTSVTQGAHGTVTIMPDKTTRYAPAANYNGPDSFTYTISDGNGGTATGTVTITVTPANDAPAATADSATVAEDGNVNVNVLGNDTDVDGDTLSVSAVTQGSHGTVVINPDKTVKYTPSANYYGSDSFTYTASDGNGGNAVATVTITITSVNDAPVAVADSAGVGEDGFANIFVLGNDTDADGDTLSVSAVTQGSHGTVAINPDKTVKYTPAANYNGSDSFTYTVSDGNGGTATGTVTVTVSAVNDPPTASADAAAVAEDGSVDVNVLANDTDPDGDVLSVASISQGAHGTVAINPDKTVKYTPVANYNGPDGFSYTVSDGNGGTSAATTVAITVTAVNDAPVAVNDSATVVAGSAVTVSVLANDADVDGPSLTVAGVTQGTRGTVAINPDQTVTYTAGPTTGTDSFTYTVSDGAGGAATATVNVTLTAPGRVVNGLQARYNFNEGSGSAVSDSSGVGIPLTLSIGSTSSVTWVSGGLRVNTATAISSSSGATKIISAAQSSNEITIEAWVTPSSLTLTGPARIATISKNGSQRNLIFGQSGNRYEAQVKTSTGTAALQTPASSLTQTLTHVVYTRSSSGQATWYINGVQSATATTTGNFSTWGTDHKLTLSDNWQGTYFLLAVYGRALTAGEVQQNYVAGVNAN